jgi:hypothetical protein
LKFSRLFRFIFASFNCFCIEAKKFASVSLRSENDGSFSLPFCFNSLRSEKDGSFLLPFRFISLRSENDGSFLLFFVLFSLHSIFVSLQISTFRIDAKQAKKALFSHRSEKNFASFRFEAKMTAHPSGDALGNVSTCCLETFKLASNGDWRPVGKSTSSTEDFLGRVVDTFWEMPK